jgi:head-tail adaptor
MSVAQQVLVGKPRTASGLRDKLVTIQQMAKSKGPSGFPVETWTTLRTAYMSKQDVRADERYAANHLLAAIETQWHSDYAADIDPDVVNVATKRRIVYSGRTFDILAASIIGKKEGVEFITLAKADDSDEEDEA